MKNAEYWKQRFEQLEQAQNQMGAYTFSGIEKQYKEAQKQIEAQIAVWYQRFAKNNGITLAEARQFLKGSDLKEFKWDVQDYIKYGQENALTGGWMKELENASAKYHITKLEALKVHTQHSLETMFAKQQITMQEAMTDVFSSSYYHTAYELQHGFNVGWDIAGLDQPQIEKVLSKPWAADKYNFSERIWNNKQKLISEVHHELTQNIMLGADPQKAIDSISKKMNTSKHNAGRLVMTEEAYFSSAAQKDCFGDLGVEQYEIVATLDSHTSDICRSLDGKVFPMADYQAGVTAPPFHVYCRSTTVPHFDENFGDIGERAARDDETGKTYYVPDDMNYQDWKETFVDGGDKSGFDVLDDGSAIHYKKQNTDSDSRQEEMNKPQAVSAASSFVPSQTVQEAQEYAGKFIEQRLGDKTFKKGEFDKLAPEFVSFMRGKALDKSAESGIIKARQLAQKKTFNYRDFDEVVDEKSVSELKQYAAEKMGINHISGIDKLKNGRQAHELLSKVEELSEQYGKRFTRVSLFDYGDERTAAETVGNELRLNVHYLNRPGAFQAVLDEWNESGRIPKGCNNVAYVAKHEYSHLFTQDIIDMPKSRILTEIRRQNVPPISKNAETDTHEYVADLLSAIKLSPKQKKLKETIISIVMKG